MRPDQSPPEETERTTLLSRMATRLSPALHRFFERRTAQSADVPDLVQEVFLRLSRLPDPAAIEKPEHYLFTTATSVLRDHARRGAVRGGGLHDPLADDLPGSDFAPDRVLEGREAAERLHAVLTQLPERTRDIFVLRVMEGMKMAEVARMIGISTRAAEKHQAKALARVTEALEDWRHR